MNPHDLKFVDGGADMGTWTLPALQSALRAVKIYRNAVEGTAGPVLLGR